MQLSARILTALAVLAFVVGVVVGAQNANHDVSAATGTIDAANLGTCTTTNADVFNFGNDCLQKNAFFQQNAIEELIEVDTLYATYAHDPRTAAEAPRAILNHSDHIRISVTDKGRDRRDPVLVATAQETNLAATTDHPNGVTYTDSPADPVLAIDFTEVVAVPTNDPPIEAYDAELTVAEELEVMQNELPRLEQQVQFDGGADLGGNDNQTTYTNSGTYEIIWERETGENNVFKPIAPDGVVKFFGRVNLGGTPDPGYGEFGDLGDYITLDEDVISGEENEPPVMTLNISVPDATNGAVQIQVIYYETSGIEFMIGGGVKDNPNGPDDICVEDLHLKTNPGEERIFQQAACTSDEVDDGAAYVLYAESDEDAADDKRHLALRETGRFTGVFQGTLRLTDADGDGGGENWGREKGHGEFHLADTTTDTPAMTTDAVIGVSNGPVTITYKDTDGRTRNYQIEIDITPPSISVDSPTHGGRSDDETPSFIGTFNDADSGLQANSFQLDVDNQDDGGDEVPVIFEASGVESGVPDNGQVRRRQDYAGYDTNALFGILSPVDGDDRVVRNSDPLGSAGTYQGIYKVDDENPGSCPGPSECYKSVEAHDFDDGAPDGEFNDEIEIDFDEAVDDFGGFNNAVDFQAVVRDLAGNLGFSDSQPTAPRFINALGEEKADDRDPNGKKHNVLGVFSRHVVYIDEIDPVIMEDASVTGFYGLDDDDVPVRDRSAIMVVFDNSVNEDLIDNGTFSVELDEETALEVVDVDVEGKLVFLKLGDELASDATPTIEISEGREVEDLAGNLLTWQEEGGDAFKVKDGIRPVFTVTLSGGSGTGIGSEGPSKLTSESMNIDIESDEDINGSPKVIVVCSNIQWTDGDNTRKLSNYVGNRTGYSVDTSSETAENANLGCGGSYNPTFNDSSSLARPGNNWVYAWRNTTDPDADRHLRDGKLTVVVWGADRSDFVEHKDDFCVKDTDDALADGVCHNYGSQTSEFVLDDTFNSPLNEDGSGGSVQPEADSDVKEPRPFIYLDFAGENTSVRVTEFMVDGEDVHAELDSVGDNRFLYWPEDLAFGTHEVSFDARDAADNEPSGRKSFEFDVTARDPFVIDLTAGWNAISFPANPVDTALDAVFTEEAVDRVVGWNPLSSAGPWSIATRVDGVWTTSANFAPLTDVVVRYGYWVHSAAFVEQSVDLRGQINRETDGAPAAIGIITVPGWNFVGVVDQDGDQTEDHFGKELRARDGDLNEIVSAEEYMGDFTRAYTWDAIANGYRILDDDDAMTIGDGIWVFFPEGNTVAP